MFTTLLMSMLGAMGLASLSAVAAPEETPDDTTRLSAPDSPADAIDGTQWRDALTGTNGDDWINGARGFDTLDGQEGDDTLHGDEGRDLLTGGTGDDLLDGGAWHDALGGDAGDDTLQGGTGMDTLLGGGGNDSLDGGEWDDLLIGGTGADVLAGGKGDDILFGNAPQEGLTAAQFHDGLQAIWEDAEAWAGLSPEQQTALAQEVLGRFIDGNAPLPAPDAGDTLNGGAGDDTLFVGADDLATGGDGADHFYVGNWVGSGAEITDFSAQDFLTVTYDASSGAVAPIIGVSLLQNGDQVITADGVEVARLIQPETPATVASIEVVGLLTSA